jgi:G3E family GTPase
MKLILVGGFLGSGKTTAIVIACKLLRSRGQSVAVITNDQGEQQVDYAYVHGLGINSKEVSNGCFCCNYLQLDQHIQSLTAHTAPEFIFAEAVGSCTDIVATVVRPLKKFNPAVNVLLCVFIDAELLTSIVESRASFITDSIQYIFKKQLEEADVLVINKTDKVSSSQIDLLVTILNNDYPGKRLLRQNSLDSEDFDKWLNLIEVATASASRSLHEIDYDVYGKGEAELAWVDKVIKLNSKRNDAQFISERMIGRIFDHLQQERLTIGHLKFYLESDAGNQKISFTTTSTSSTVRVSLPETKGVTILINARVQTTPHRLVSVIESAMQSVQSQFDCTIAVGKSAAFAPGYPTPAYRIGNDI